MEEDVNSSPQPSRSEFDDADADDRRGRALQVLNALDGSPESAVSLLTGIPVDEFDNYGGFPSDQADLETR